MTIAQIFSKATTRPASRHKESPLGLFIACIQERLNLSEREHRAAFKRLLFEDGYEDFLIGVIDEWIGIKYSTALRGAQPISVQGVKERADKKAKARAAEAARMENAVKVIGQRMLDLQMPNGKLLRDCTGAQCEKFGGFYAAIGKRVGPRGIVGKKLTGEDLMAEWKGSRK